MNNLFGQQQNKASSPQPSKFTQRRIKVSSQGLFFNNQDLEKKL